MADRVPADAWASFPIDPRDPASAPLRASDADRDVVHDILTAAFADGRLDRAEYDERTATTMAARTLGQLPPIVSDLVPERPLLPARVPLAHASSAEIQRLAEQKWVRERREVVFAFLGTLVFFGAIAFFVTWWTLVIPGMALLKLLRTLGNKHEIIDNEVKRLEKRQAKALEAKKKPPSGGAAGWV